ncbi:FliH/SctL family protein [Desulfosarcina sp.]|uniref:FliH/SctL family protein n=1 Tax=Desulfosarcina sp. TaxID=2027861 RepID=UPI00397090D1
MANAPKDNPMPAVDSCALYYFPEIPCGMENDSPAACTHGHFVGGTPNPNEDGSALHGRVQDRDQTRALVDEAFKKGMDQGRAEAIAAQQKKVDQAAVALKAAVEQMIRIRQRDLDRMETETVRLAVAIARKVIGHETEHGSIIGHVVKAAMKKVTDPRHLTLRLNPKDIDTVNGIQRECLPPDGFGPGFRIQADETIQQGGCIVETKLGDVDARIDRQIGIIAELLTDQLPKPITAQ